MTISLLHHTPLVIASKSIRKCYKSEGLSDSQAFGDLLYLGEKDKNLIHRIGNQMKHKSTLRHVQYVFECDNISTKTLLALTRHSIGKDISVESTRFTLSKRANELSYTKTGNKYVDDCNEKIMEMVAIGVEKGIKNDDLSMLLSQAYNYSFIMTMNIQSLQHFLELRTNSQTAHWDIVNFANALADKIPEEHKYLFDEYLYKDNK
jgi:thymidylate synthase (FAD)